VISKKCKICRKPNRPFKNTCSIECEAELGLKLLEKRKRAEAKNVRAIDKVRKEKLKSRAEWIADAQKAFNAFIRARDADKPCICCSKPFEPNRPGGSMDAGHFLSRGSAPHLRFNENNVFGQRKNCNRPGGAKRNEFRAGVIARIGLQAVEELESNNDVVKWTIDDLKQIKEKYRKKLRDLKTTVD